MRENIASFSIMKERDELKKMAHIARVCYPFMHYTEDSDDVIQKLAEDKNVDILDHGTAIFRVSFSVFEMFKNLVFVQNAKQTIDGNRILRFSNLNDQYLVSGSFYDWSAVIMAFSSTHREVPMESGTFKAINMGIGRILDRYLKKPADDSYAETGVFEIMDVEDLTPEERMIHQRQTIWFKVSGTVAHILEKTRGASVSNASDNGGSSVKMMEPIFFADSETEIAADLIISSEIVWEAATKKAAEVYKDLIAFGVSPTEASSVLPGSAPTDLFMTMSLSQWKNVFSKYLSSKTYYGVREVMGPALTSMQNRYPFMFEGIRPQCLTGHGPGIDI